MSRSTAFARNLNTFFSRFNNFWGNDEKLFWKNVFFPTFPFPYQWKISVSRGCDVYTCHANNVDASLGMEIGIFL